MSIISVFDNMKKIKIVTLGCDKNLVDSEMLAGRLSEKFELSPDFEDGEAVVINTCGFIGDAKKQSVEAIFSAVREKNEGKFRKVLVTGCLIERYYDEMKKEIEEVDGFFRLGDFEEMAKFFSIGSPAPVEPYRERIALESSHYSFIKISDGCNQKCSYCAIPGIRGRYISRTVESICSEAEFMINSGVKEVILVGQEISSYGKDLYKKRMISHLLKELSKICGKKAWIRLLYTHPYLVDREFIETVAQHENICNYIDLPVQHTRTEILRSMGRRDTTDSLYTKIRMIREIIPDIAIRTSIITGFPGETVKVFNCLKKDISELRFDRLGVFPFSKEEGTRAFGMQGQISRKTAEKRASGVMDIQREISYENNSKLVGTVQTVLIDRIEGQYSAGRTYRDAPDVDNEVFCEKKLKPGKFCRVKIVRADDYDLYGEFLSEMTFPF